MSSIRRFPAIGFTNTLQRPAQLLLGALVLVLAACGGEDGQSTTTTTAGYPVNEQFAAALTSQGVPEAAARFFAAATRESSCAETTCTYTYTYPNGDTRKVTVTATGSQQYTPTTDELALTASISKPVYNWKFSASGMDANPSIETSYFIPATNQPGAPLSTRALQFPSIALSQGTAPGDRVIRFAPAVSGATINWKEIGTRAKLANDVKGVYENVSDTVSAYQMGQQVSKWLQELDQLEKCAANPTNPLAQKNPDYSASTVANLHAIREQIKELAAMRFLNQLDKTAEGLADQSLGWGTMAVLSIPLGQLHDYSDQTLQNLSEQYMQEARSSVVSCAPDVPTNLVATAVSDSQINLTWQEKTDVPVTGYKVYGSSVATALSTSYSDYGLNPSTEYCYTVSAYNDNGESLKSAQACATTFGPPIVNSTSPSAGENNVAVSVVIRANFSEEIDPKTINSSTFTVSGPDGSVAGSVTYSAKTATFTPAAQLKKSTTYTATITTGVKDLDGYAMKANHTWTFTTVADNGMGNFQFTHTGSDGSRVSGYADITWTLFDTATPDVSGYFATGTITADITPAFDGGCDTVHVTKPLDSNSGTGSRMNVYLGNNNLWPNTYSFILTTGNMGSQTFNCGTPRKAVTFPQWAITVNVGGYCGQTMNNVPFTDPATLAQSHWTCGQSMGYGISGLLDATWNFKF
jgi:hypothetical protein